MTPAAPPAPPAPPGPHTALAVLFGSDTDALEALAGRIASDPGTLGRALQDLPEAARAAAAREAAAAAAGLLDVDLFEVLVAGWRKYQDLTASARRTLAVPGSIELVQLANHRVTAAQHPYVTVLVDDHRVATVDLELSVDLDISALLADISAGLLAALQSGHCDITATLAIEGAEVITRHAHLELPGAIPLGDGIRLLPASDYPHSVGTVEGAEDHQPGADTAAPNQEHAPG
jgi:hypothetical protein